VKLLHFGIFSHLSMKIHSVMQNNAVIDEEIIAVKSVNAKFISEKKYQMKLFSDLKAL